VDGARDQRAGPDAVLPCEVPEVGAGLWPAPMGRTVPAG
jgi:hypothetical protein